MINAGKYDTELIEALTKAESGEGMLFIMDGKKGPGISSKMSLHSLHALPRILRGLADQLEKDMDAIISQNKRTNLH